MSDSDVTHIVLLPSSGMGHLTPFLRIAASLVSNYNCKITFMTIHPTVSLSESKLITKFLSSFPQITPKQFHLLPFDPSTNSQDPFFLHIESIRRSAHLLYPLLTSLSSPPVTTLVIDITLASAFLPVASDLNISSYILFTSSAKMLSLCAYFSKIFESFTEINDYFEIPGSSPLPISWVPPVLFDLSNLFTTQFIENGYKLIESNGILINTFESLETETLQALNDGKVVNGFPPVIPIGPLVPNEFEKVSSSLLQLKWLDNEQSGSVVYVSFGSRTAMSREQIRELGVGLVRSGCRFLWVVKIKKVDRDEEEGLEMVLGNELMERVKEKGLVLKEWVDQDEILGHPSVGGFVSHCGWNSVTEAALHGVPMLAWPQHGDQRINAAVVEKNGFGLWTKNWGWGNGEDIVKGEEIGEKIREMMNDKGLRLKALYVRDEAKKANEVDGSSKNGFSNFIKSCNKS